MVRSENVCRLAIGVAGGFNPEADKKKFDVIEETHLVVFPDLDTLIPIQGNDDNVPLGISLAAKAVISAQSATRKAEVEAAAGTWDGEVLQVLNMAIRFKDNQTILIKLSKNFPTAHEFSQNSMVF